MAKQTNSKKGKRRRVPLSKTQYYWTVSHTGNMVLRGIRVLKQHGQAAAQSFITLHSAGCKVCELILQAQFDRAAGLQQGSTLGTAEEHPRDGGSNPPSSTTPS